MRLELINEDPIHIRVTWDPPQNPHGTIKSYKLEWGKVGSDTNFKSIAVTGSRQSYVADDMCMFTD